MRAHVAGETRRRRRRLRAGGRVFLTRTFLVFAAAALAAPLDAAGQSTRAEVIQEAQAEKRKGLQPPRKNGVERTIEWLEEWGLIAGEPRGFYPWLGSVYPGGGFAGGLGYRKPFGDDGAINVFGGYSINTFSRAQVDVALPTFAGHRARLTLSGRYVDAPDVRYFGVGNSSSVEDETRFAYTPIGGGARLDVRGSKYFTLGGGADYLSIDTASGRTAPSIEERFTPADTPGLGISEFTYLHSTAYASFDWRKTPGYSGRGGLYRVQFSDFREQDLDRYSFRSLEAEARQLIPILRANWVIALRGLATVTDMDDPAAVPYFLLPALGGGSTLRGYPDFRFRDRHRMLLSAELRWTPARFMDMAVFYDTGKVAARRADLDFDDLQESYGVGLRIVGPEGYLLRVEVAHSREHNARLIFGAGGEF
jgi:outer membrane protein assembly factor BamA